jgi:hypothetical protein
MSIAAATDPLRVDITAGEYTMSLVPDAALNGRALAGLLNVFDWTSCKVIRCASALCDAMWSAFEAEATRSRIKILANFTMTPAPAVDTEAYLKWEEELIDVSLDELYCTDTRIIVLIVDDVTIPETIFEVARRNAWHEWRITFVAPQVALGAANTPRGTFVVQGSSHPCSIENVRALRPRDPAPRDPAPLPSAMPCAVMLYGQSWLSAGVGGRRRRSAEDLPRQCCGARYFA